MFEIAEDEERIRQYSVIDFDPNKSSYLSRIFVYRIGSDSWSDDAWRSAGVIVPPAIAK